MKKLITLLFAVCVILCVLPSLVAFAAETDDNEPSNVTITVVLPDKETKQEPEETPAPVQPTEIKMYPVDVTENAEGNRRQIVKTYELTAAESPADIPRADFERNGWRYSLTDILKRETANAETKPHTETITLNTDTKDLEKILTLLAPTMEYKTDDEFVGVLQLDVTSIKIETAGTKTTSYEMKVTREYPHLSAADTSLVPKTVSDNGKTYNLANVDWKAGNYVTIDYEQVPEYYTAYATYTATGSSTKVTGYVTTAVYNGTLAKLAQGKTVYTAYFEGAEIRTPLEMVTSTEMPTATTPNLLPTESEDAPTEQTITETAEPTATPTAEPVADTDSGGSSNAALYVIIALLAVLLVCAFMIIFRKGKFNYAKTHHNSADAGSDDSVSDSGSRG